MKKFTLYIITFIMLMVLQRSAFSQGVWDWPVKPSSPEWSSLSYEERIAAQQIPEDILEKMSTKDVYLSWVSLPSRLEILVSSVGMQDGFDKQLVRYNVLSTLLARDDSGSTLLRIYRELDPITIEQDWDAYRYDHYIDDIAFLEFIISQSAILKSFSEGEIRQLVTQVINYAYQKQYFENINFWHQTSMVLLIRILEHEKYPELIHRLEDDRTIKTALEYGVFSGIPGDKAYDEMIDMAEKYLNTTSIEYESPPHSIKLTIFPNPFNSTATIEYSVPTDAHVTVAVFNISGQKVSFLADSFKTSGNYSVMWDASQMPSGIYFSVVKADNLTVSEKMLFLK